MSIASDIRAYADTAVNQGKHVLDQAQAQLYDVTGQASQLYGKTNELVTGLADKASVAVNDLRASAEKAVNLDAIKTAVEPYLVQAKGYTHTVTDRAEVLLAGVRKNERVAKLVDSAGTVSGVLVGTVYEQLGRVIKPVQSLTGRDATPPAATPAPAQPAAATEPAATEPATTRSAATKPAAAKPAATKPATPKPATKAAARKAPVQRPAE
jgi:hypothetical protein